MIGILLKSLPGIIPSIMGILLMGNSLLEHSRQNSGGQFLAGLFLLLAGIILLLSFNNEEKTNKFIQSLISRD